MILYWLLIGHNRVSTDNAYVNADIGRDHAPDLRAGRRSAGFETQPVKTGPGAGPARRHRHNASPSTRPGPSSARLERKVRGYFATDQALAGQVAARNADIVSADAQIASAKSDLDRARTELGRRERLAASRRRLGRRADPGAEPVPHRPGRARPGAAPAKVQAPPIAARPSGPRAVNTALIAGASFDDNPEVAAARANVTRPSSISTAPSSRRRSTASSPRSRSRSASGSRSAPT